MRYLTVALCLAAAFMLTSVPSSAQDGDPVLYVSEHEISWDRMDSLRTLTTKYAIPFEEFISSRVDGYARYYYVHHTGGKANYVIATMYPDWDFVDGDEIDRGSLWEEYKTANNISDDDSRRIMDGFRYAHEGGSHEDMILTPLMATD